MNEVKNEMKIEALRRSLIKLIQLLMDGDQNFREEMENLLRRVADKV